MDEACKVMEREFRKISVDLDYVAGKVESEFKPLKGEFPDVVALVRRMHALKLKMAVLNGKVDEYESLKRELYNENDPIVHLFQNTEAMDEILCKTKCDGDEDWTEARRQLHEAHQTSKCC